jgi:hypothetical protein
LKEGVPTFETPFFCLNTVNGVYNDAPASYLNWGGNPGPFKVVNVPGIWENSRTQAFDTAYDNIMNLDGRVVRTAKNVSSVNVSDLANGMYSVTIKEGNRISTQKVIITRN